MIKKEKRRKKKKKKRKKEKGMGFGFFTQPSKFFQSAIPSIENLYPLYLHEPRPTGLI